MPSCATFGKLAQLGIPSVTSADTPAFACCASCASCAPGSRLRPLRDRRPSVSHPNRDGIPTACTLCGARLLNPHELSGVCRECKLVLRNERLI